MIQELRIYKIKVGRLKEYLQHFETIGLPIVGKYQYLAGFWTVEVGEINEIYHLWDFASPAHRDEVRAQLLADEKWHSDFMPKARELIEHQRSMLLRPTSFSPKFNSGLGERG